jgi:hypothetical protein
MVCCTPLRPQCARLHDMLHTITAQYVRLHGMRPLLPHSSSLLPCSPPCTRKKGEGGTSFFSPVLLPLLHTHTGAKGEDTENRRSPWVGLQEGAENRRSPRVGLQEAAENRKGPWVGLQEGASRREPATCLVGLHDGPRGSLDGVASLQVGKHGAPWNAQLDGLVHQQLPRYG